MESFNLCSSASFSLTFPSFRLVSTLSFLFRFRFHLILSSQFCSLDSPFAVSCRVNQTIKFGFSHWQKFPSDRALSCCHRHLIVFRSWSQQKRRRRRRQYFSEGLSTWPWFWPRTGSMKQMFGNSPPPPLIKKTALVVVYFSPCFGLVAILTPVQHLAIQQQLHLENANVAPSIKYSALFSAKQCPFLSNYKSACSWRYTLGQNGKLATATTTRMKRDAEHILNKAKNEHNLTGSWIKSQLLIWPPLQTLSLWVITKLILPRYLARTHDDIWCAPVWQIVVCGW